MEEQIEIIVIHDGNGVEPDTCYRLDNPESAIHCFDHFKNNFERDEQHKFTIKKVSGSEWLKIVHLGEEFA